MVMNMGTGMGVREKLLAAADRSPSRRRTQRRSPREWALRGGIAVAALVLGYISGIEALAFSIAESDVEQAYALNPDDGRIEAKLAEQLMVGGGGADQQARSVRLAHKALLKEPLAVSALTAMALNDQMRGETGRARNLFIRSDALSRREFGAQLWLIEDAVGRGDIPGALKHYDIALRTTARAPELLFPVLSSAISDPRIARELARVLAKRPGWSEAFAQYVSTSGAYAKSAARLFRLLSLEHVAVPKIAAANAVNGLITANAFDSAWDYYRTLRKGADRRYSRDPRFGAQIEIPTAFDWTPVMIEAGIAASIQKTAKDGVFEFAAPATVGGTVLQQMQVLPPGSYNLEGHTMGIALPDGERPYWSLVCVDGREVGRVELRNSSEADGNFAGSLVVSNTCPAQLLRLVVRPSNAVSGASGQIDNVQLGPLQSHRSSPPDKRS